MQKQKTFFVMSVEKGVKRIRKSENIAVIGGKETLFFNIQRYGKFALETSMYFFFITVRVFT